MQKQTCNVNTKGSFLAALECLRPDVATTINCGSFSFTSTVTTDEKFFAKQKARMIAKARRTAKAAFEV